MTLLVATSGPHGWCNFLVPCWDGRSPGNVNHMRVCACVLCCRAQIKLSLGHEPALHKQELGEEGEGGL
jgi:hypothetical protein